MGSVLFHHFLLVKAPRINLVGPLTLGNTTDESRKATSRIAVEGDHVAIYPSGYLEAGFVLLQSNQTLVMNTGSRVKSLQNSSCNTNGPGSDPFVCIAKNSVQETFNMEEFLKTYNN